MNPKYHLLIAVATLSLNACSTDDTCPEPVSENKEHKISFTVEEDAETRTTLEMLETGNFLRWVPTDKVGIYTSGNNVNSNILTTADVNQSPVEFIGTLIQPVSSGDMFYAYYPYNAAQLPDPTAVRLSIPATQKQTQAGVYNGESHPLVAVPMEFSQEWSNAGRISNVRFRQLGAIVELQLYSSDEALRSEKIRSVTFESEDTPLAGDFSFDLKTVTVKEELSISGYELNVVRTSLEKPAAIPAASDKAARVYLTIAPGQYTGQIVVRTDAAKYTFRLTKAMTFERAVIKGLPADLARVERIDLSPDDLVTVNHPIHFEDPIVEKICLRNWNRNGDGELSYKEAADVTDLKAETDNYTVFYGNRFIVSFNELQYFTGLRSIGNGAFAGCVSLTSIHIPDGVTSIEPNAFEDCRNLTSIYIPDGVTTIGYGAFDLCMSLTNITIPDGVTTIEDGVFRLCSSLTSIHIPEGVTTIGKGAFMGCTSLTSINIPDGVTSIGIDAFSNCSSLTSIIIPDGVTTIEEGTFSDCTNLTSITIPDGVTSIGKGAFMGCSNLTSITIPDGVTSIGKGAFMGCSSLTSITIPDGVTSIGESAFDDCSNLTGVYCKPTTPPTFDYYQSSYYPIFQNTPSSMKIYVPAASVNAYKTAEGWSGYASQIVADNN